MDERPTDSPPTEIAPTATEHEVLVQEVARLRSLLQEARAGTRREAWAKARRQIRVPVAVLALAALVVGGLIGHFGFTSDPRGPASEPTLASLVDAPATLVVGTAALTVSTPWPLSVYVSGAVHQAQVVELPPGSLIADALERAGGATSDADLDAINLAAPVAHNQHIVIPRVIDTGTTGSGQTTAPHAATAVRININNAPREELMSLPHIGEARANDIVAYRTSHGAFATVEDIQDVPGIGPGTFEQIAHLITVGD